MIVVLYPQLDGVGGIARYLQSFLGAAAASGDGEVTVLAARVPESIAGMEQVHAVELKAPKGRFGLLAWGWRVRRYLKEQQALGHPVLVNLHLPPLIPSLFVPAGIPLVITAHTTYLGMSGRFNQSRDYKSQWSGASIALRRWLETRVFRRASAIITLTEQGRREVAEYGYQGDIAIIPNGVDIDTFAPQQASEKDIDLIFLGRIEQRKGSRSLVTLCERLVEQRPDLRIVIVGYGDDDDYVISKLGGYPGIQLAGKRPFDEVIGFLARSKMYVSTSYYEGLPGTCLEAMAMALPVVVWDFAFYDGLVTDGGTGFRVPANDIGTMVARIGSLLDDPAFAEQCGWRGRAVVETDYSWKGLAPRLMQTFRRVALREHSPDV